MFQTSVEPVSVAVSPSNSARCSSRRIGTPFISHRSDRPLRRVGYAEEFLSLEAGVGQAVARWREQGLDGAA